MATRSNRDRDDRSNRGSSRDRDERPSRSSSNRRPERSSGRRRERVNLNATTPVGIACFPAFWEPKEGLNGEDQYGLVLVMERNPEVPEGSSSLKELKELCIKAARAKWGDEADDLLEDGDLKLPFRRATAYDKYGPPFEGDRVMISLKTSTAPGVVDRYKDRKTGKARVITDEDEVYAGALVRCTVYAHAYDTRGNKGVTFLLNNVQKWEDGERLAGRAAAADDFDAEDSDEAAEVDSDIFD